MVMKMKIYLQLLYFLLIAAKLSLEQVYDVGFFPEGGQYRKTFIKNANDQQLPDDIEVQDYYIHIQPYFPADGINITNDRNMTFDGITTVNFLVKANIKSFVFHSYQLTYKSYELFDGNGNPFPIKEIHFVENLQHIVITPIELPRVGVLYSLRFIYTGIIHPYSDGGLYYTYYDDVTGKRHWMVSTHMENGVQARAVFPCIDQPSAKAVFHLTLIYPKTLIALGNQMEIAPISYNEQWNIARFLPSLRMSSYLVALAIGPFVSKSVRNGDGTLVRIWGWTGQEEYLEFAADVSSKCLHEMGRYTNIVYPMTKSDQIGLPEFRAGAMENWGLVIYKYQYIAFNPKLHTTYVKQAAAKVMCHELAHQWFGDLVTAAWWSDLFLNEGFAAYFEIQSLKMALPEQSGFLEGKFLVETEQSGLNADASSSSHPVYHNAVIFDDITYKKGPSILRMVEFMLGAEVFREGLQDYLATYKYHNAKHNMLFEKLTAAARRNNVLDWCNNPINMTEFLNPWILQQSFPLVTVTVDNLDGGVRLTQQSYSDIRDLPQTSYNYSWTIPIFQKSYNSVSKYQWLIPDTYKCGNDQTSRKNVDSMLWTMSNAECRSFIRVDYDDVAFLRLLKHLKANRDTDFTMEDKIVLIGDQMALLQKRMAANEQFSFKRLLDLLLIILPNYPHYSVFELTNEILLSLEAYYIDSLDYPLFKMFMKLLLAKNYDILRTTNTNDWDNNIVRDYILPNAVRYDVSTASADLYMLFKQFQTACMNTTTGVQDCAQSFHPDIHRGIYCAGIRSADNSHETTTLNSLYHHQITNGLYFYQEYYAMLEGLACTQQRAELYSVIKEFLIARKKFANKPSYSYITRNPLGTQALYDYFVDNAADVVESDSLDTYFNAMVATWYSTRRLKQFINLNNTVRSLMNTTDADRIMNDHIKKLRSQIAFADNHLPKITKYLYDNFVQILDESGDEFAFAEYLPDFYSLHIRPYFSSSIRYPWYRNMTFEATVDVNFTVLMTTNVVRVAVHRLIINKDNVFLQCNLSGEVEIDSISKNYSSGILLLFISPKNLLVVNDICTLMLKYTGFIADHPAPGINTNYNYFEFNDKKAWIFATDFESSRGIRSMVPSFDVPWFKTNWRLVLEHPADMVPLSNMPAETEDTNRNGTTTTTFMISPKMASHQVAIAVGHFAAQEAVSSNSGVVGRVWAWTGMEVYANRALKVLIETLDFIDDLFNVHYPLPKIDVIALPQYWNGHGTLDNFGIISGDYNVILEDPLYTTTADRMAVTDTIAEAVIKQLFNGFIGPKKFIFEPINNGISKYLSLNFIASRLEAKQTDIQELLHFLNTEASFEFDTTGTFAVIDAENSAKANAGAKFRSAAVFGMLNNTIGYNTLLNVMQNLLQTEQFGTIDDASLANALKTAIDCSHLSENAKNEEKNITLTILEQFLKQKSYPILKVECDAGRKLKYSVESYHSNSDTQQAQWILPVYSQTESGIVFHYFRGQNDETFWDRPFSGEWQVENIERKGLFRVFYDDTVWKPIYKALEANASVFDSLTVAGIIADSAALQRKGMLPWSRVLDLSLILKNESRLLPWYSFLSTLKDLIGHSYGSVYYTSIKNYVQSLLVSIYDQVAWNHSDNWIENIVASVITEISCKIGYQKCLSYAESSFEDFIRRCQNARSGTDQCNQMHPDFRKTQYCYGIALNFEEINTVESLYMWFVNESKYFARDQENLLYSLSCGPHGTVERLISKTVDGMFPAKFLNYLGQSKNGSEELWNYLKVNTAHVMYGAIDFGQYIEATIQQWNDDDAVARVDNFMNSLSSELLSADSRKVLDDAKATIIVNKQWLSENFGVGSNLLIWLKEHNFYTV